jgi:hypothetical protein
MTESSGTDQTLERPIDEHQTDAGAAVGTEPFQTGRYDSDKEIAAMLGHMQSEWDQSWTLRDSHAGYDSPARARFMAEARAKRAMPDDYRERLKSGIWSEKIKARQKYDQLEGVAATIGTLLGGSDKQPSLPDLKRHYFETPVGRVTKKRLRDQYPS